MQSLNPSILQCEESKQDVPDTTPEVVNAATEGTSAIAALPVKTKAITTGSLIHLPVMAAGLGSR